MTVKVKIQAIPVVAFMSASHLQREESFISLLLSVKLNWTATGYSSAQIHYVCEVEAQCQVWDSFGTMLNLSQDNYHRDITQQPKRFYYKHHHCVTKPCIFTYRSCRIHLRTNPHAKKQTENPSLKNWWSSQLCSVLLLCILKVSQMLSTHFVLGAGNYRCNYFEKHLETS